MLSFHEIELKWGEPVAHHILAEIEKAARVPSSQTIGLDPETRFANALRIQDTWTQNQQQAA